MDPATLRLKPNARARVLQGHPWVFANEVEQLLGPEHDGETVGCLDRSGRPLGTGIYNSRSQIVWRRISREKTVLDGAYLRAAIARALERRSRPELPQVCRLIWSESDDLPGVVADRYGDTVVVQIQTLAMERRSQALGDLLAEALKPAEIVFRNDTPIRRLEGLPQESHTRSGAVLEPRWVRIDGVDYWLDLQGGQKTGFYLDQRLQHAAVARYCGSASVLDAFCNQGAFALHAARAGAARVLGLDSAPEAVAAAARNAARAGVQAVFQEANVFDWLNAPENRIPNSWDVVILDPPPFAKSRSAMEGALRGYKEINLRAMQLLKRGGILATYSCSHHMQESDLREVLVAASGDARRRLRVLEYARQPADHPVILSMPESEYLRGYILSVE